MISKEFITEIESTNSPLEKLHIVLTHYKDLSDEEMEYLKNFFELKIEEKRSQGLAHALKRDYKKGKYSKTKKKQTYENFLFVTDYNAHGKCMVCGEEIDSNVAFRRFVDGAYQDYHIFDICMPDEYKSKMKSNQKYIEYIRTSK